MMTIAVAIGGGVFFTGCLLGYFVGRLVEGRKQLKELRDASGRVN